MSGLGKIANINQDTDQLCYSFAQTFRPSIEIQ